MRRGDGRGDGLTLTLRGCRSTAPHCRHTVPPPSLMLELSRLYDLSVSTRSSQTCEVWHQS